jgi:flagellar motor switch protein FliG
MARLDEQDHEIADGIRQLMFTFDDIARLGEPEIRAMLESV